MRRVVGTGLVGAFALVAAVQGLDVLALWNAVPLGVAAAMWIALERRAEGRDDGPASRRRRIGRGFAVCVALAVGGVHLAWALDWGGTATGSSTAGLLLVVAPLLALLGGGLWALAVRLVDRRAGE